jgi:hypothetical protein
MIQYTIQFELNPDKLNEFTLSWKYFYKNTREAEGLNDCKMIEIGDNHHEISMTWSERYYLNLFMKGEWHNFLQGAVNVLGDKSIITQKDIQPD